MTKDNDVFDFAIVFTSDKSRKRKGKKTEINDR
jgi:hypothetical protein